MAIFLLLISCRNKMFNSLHSFSHRFGVSGAVEFFGNLLCAATEREQQTGEKILELLTSVCRYETFPFSGCFDDDDDEFKEYQTDVLLDLCSKVKNRETQTGLSLLPALQLING